MSDQEHFFLIGDIGGTNLRVELRDAKNHQLKRVDVKTAEFKNFEEFLTSFFAGLEVKPDQVYAAISIASKIQNNKAITNANYKWELTDGNAVKAAFNFKEMVLLNDFEACGYAVPALHFDELVTLKAEQLPNLNQDYKILLVGPGTGLGVCLVNRRHGQTIVMSSEGGHIGMAVWDQEQFEFQEFAKQKFGLGAEIISAEWLFCGVGIPYLYEFHAQKHGLKVMDNLKGEDIFAKLESDPIAQKTFNHFLKLLGTCLSHLSAAFLPDEGIFLCNNILRALIGKIKEDTAREDSFLLSAFTNNKCVGSYLRNIPIFYTPEVDLSLKGCWQFLQMLKK